MGSSGHLSHIVEDWTLTFNDVKDVISSAADARLESVTEKTDGTELVFTWNEAEQRIGAARNGSDIKSGGMTAKALAGRFQGRGGLEVALTSAFDALSRAVSNLQAKERLRIFGPSGERWFSIEIMHSAWPRTIHYGGDNIVFHERPVFMIDRTTGVVTKDTGTAGRVLSDVIGGLRAGVSGTAWNLHPRAAIELERLTDGTVAAAALAALDSTMAETGVHDSDTIETYVRKRLDAIVDSETGMTLPDAAHSALIARLMHDKGAPTVVAISRMVPELKDAVRDIVSREKELAERAVEPIETLIREFASGVLLGVRSLFMVDHDFEAERLRAATTAAITALKNSSAPAAKAMLATQAAKIGRIDSISPIEGIVFMYKGRPYKLTGAFAPMNRVLSFIAFNSINENTAARRPLCEGGGSFSEAAPISLRTLHDTWPEIVALLKRAGAARIEPIGTTWKKDPMGDVDVAVEHVDGREALYAALHSELGSTAVRRVGPNIVSFAFQTLRGGKRTGEHAQIDAMVGNVGYLEWARYGPSPIVGHAEHSSVKGLVRNMLLNIVAAHASGREFPGKQTELDRERLTVDFDRGLYRVLQTRRPSGSRSAPLASWKTIDRELLADRPDDVIEILLGPGHRAQKLRRFEDVVSALKSSKLFKQELDSIRDELLAMVRDHASTGNDLGASLKHVEDSIMRAF